MTSRTVDDLMERIEHAIDGTPEGKKFDVLFELLEALAVRYPGPAATGGTHVLVTGTPSEGFTFIGPVTPNDPDLEHYTDIDPKPDYWWYAKLTALPAPAKENRD